MLFADTPTASPYADSTLPTTPAAPVGRFCERSLRNPSPFAADAPTAWPAAASDAMAALENGSIPVVERRKLPRTPHHARATLVLTDVTGRTADQTVYLRDLGRWAAGLIADAELRTNVKATLHLTAPDGAKRAVNCRIRRCRAFRPGWFEASLDFDRDQADFAPRRRH